MKRTANCKLQTANSRFASRAAFTLVELLTVMAILGVLMGLLFPAFNGIRKRAFRTQAHNLVGQVAAAWQLHLNDFRSFPDTKLFDDATEEDGDIWFPMNPLNVALLNWRAPKPLDYPGTSAKWMNDLRDAAKEAIDAHTLNKPRKLTISFKKDGKETKTTVPTRDAYLEINQVLWICGLITPDGERVARKIFDRGGDYLAVRNSVGDSKYPLFAMIDTGYDGKLHQPGSFVADAEEQDQSTIINKPSIAWCVCYGETLGSW